MKFDLKLFFLSWLFLATYQYVDAQDPYLIDSVAQIESNSVFGPSFENSKYSYDTENRVTLLQRNLYRVEYKYENNQIKTTILINLDNSILSETIVTLDDDKREVRKEVYYDGIVHRYDSTVYNFNGYSKIVYNHSFDENYFIERIVSDSLSNENLLLFRKFTKYDELQQVKSERSYAYTYNQGQQLTLLVTFFIDYTGEISIDSAFYKYENDHLTSIEEIFYKSGIFEFNILSQYEYIQDTIVINKSIKSASNDNPYIKSEKEIHVLSTNNLFTYDYKEVRRFFDSGILSYLRNKLTNTINYSLNQDSVFIRMSDEVFNSNGTVDRFEIRKETWLKNALFTHTRIEGDLEISIYPNPCAPGSKLKINSEESVGKYLIFNERGQIIVSNNSTAFESYLLITPQIPGVYQLVFLTDDNKYVGTKTLLVH